MFGYKQDSCDLLIDRFYCNCFFENFKLLLSREFVEFLKVFERHGFNRPWWCY